MASRQPKAGEGATYQVQAALRAPQVAQILRFQSWAARLCIYSMSRASRRTLVCAWPLKMRRGCNVPTVQRVLRPRLHSLWTPYRSGFSVCRGGESDKQVYNPRCGSAPAVFLSITQRRYSTVSRRRPTPTLPDGFRRSAMSTESSVRPGFVNL